MPEKYPLSELLFIKKNRFDQAVKTLEEKKALLEKEYEKLYDKTQERDEIKSHKEAKLFQMRQELDQGTTPAKIEQMRHYLLTVQEKLDHKEKEVVEQQKQVDLAQKQVDIATEDLFQKKKDVEKLEIHQKEWKKEMGYLETRKEASREDEQGAMTHERQRKENLLRKKPSEE